MSAPVYPATSANVIVLWGRWYDHHTRAGRAVDIVATPRPAPNQQAAGTPNLIDHVDEAEIKTAEWRTRPLPSGLWALPLLSNNDAQLGAFGGWEIAAGNEGTFLVELLENTPSTTATQEMADAIAAACTESGAAPLDVQPGDTIQAVWVRNAAVLDGPAPLPPTGFLTSAQVVNLIADVRQLPPGGTPGQSVTPKAGGGYEWQAGSGAPGAASDARYQRVRTLSAAVGDGAADDTAAINTVLAAAPADSVVCGVPGSTYRITSALVMRPGGRQTLDLTGCTVTLKPSQNCNMIRNAGSVAAATASDGAITNGSTTLTTTATAVVGQTVTVAGAGANGNAPLTAQVTAVGSGTLTLSAPAQATVSAAAVKVFTRDRDVRIVGGNWVRGANFGTGVDNHSLLFRHVDGLTIDIDGFSSTAGKYAVSVASATRVWIRARNLSAYSDGVHLMGPLTGVRVEEITGTTGDDTFAITAADWPAYGDTSGDVLDVSVGRISAVCTAASLCKVIAGTGCKVDAFRVTDGVYGTAALNVAWLGDDAAQAATTGGTYGSIDFGALYGSAPTALLNLFSPSARQVRVRFANNQSGTLANAINIAGSSTGTIHELVIYDSDLAKTGYIGTAGLYMNAGNITIKNLILDAVRMTTLGTLFWMHAGIVTEATLRNCAIDSTDQSTYATRHDGGTLGRLNFLGGYVAGAGVAYRKDATATTAIIIAMAAGFAVVATSRVADARAGTVTFKLDQPTFDGQVNAALFTNGATLILDGEVHMVGSAALLQRNGSESVRSLGARLPLDVAALTSTAGDAAYNTNSGQAGGVGRVVSDGTRWLPVGRPLASGTATLVGGTVNVADAKITAASLIRLTTLSPGGTVGTAYVSARTAGTGFTITSTSASDTSAVYWEVAQY